MNADTVAEASGRSGAAGPDPFGISSRAEAGWAVLDVHGDLDVYTAGSLRTEISDRIDAGHARIVINLEHVDFLDSTGVSVMIGGLKLARGGQGTLVLARPCDQVRRMLHLTNLDKVLLSFASVEDALTDGDGPR